MTGNTAAESHPTHLSQTKANVLMTTPDQELDARNLNCPLPILRAKKALNGMDSGQVLKIMATDPGSVKDFVAFANQTGHELLDSAEVGQEFHFMMRKS